MYVIPPNKLLSVEKDHLELSDSKNKHGIASIDQQFNILVSQKKNIQPVSFFQGAEAMGFFWVGNMMKIEGGFTIAQDADDANHNSMPAGAIVTRVVELVLPVKDIAKALHGIQGYTSPDSNYRRSRTAFARRRNMETTF